MKIYKKIIAISLVAFLLTMLSNFSCREIVAEEAEGKKLSIVTTNFPAYDFVRAVAGDSADLKMLLKPGAESHSFEPSADDIKLIENSDLFVSAGGENETWVDKIVSSSDKKINNVKLIDLVDTVNEEIVEGMEHEHEHGHDGDEEDEQHHDGDEEHGHHDGSEEHEQHDGDEEHEHHHEEEVDEHVWTSPKNAIQIVNKLKDELINLNPAMTKTYTENAADYEKKLNELDVEFKKIVDEAKRKTIVFGDRFPLRYFADEFGLSYYAAFSGCSTQTEASAKTIKFLIDKVNEDKIPVVFKIELSNGKIAETVAAETGAKVLEFNSCHNVSKEQFDKGLTYVDLMKTNLNTLKEALQ